MLLAVGLALLGGVAGGCKGPGKVQFVEDRCLIDGQPADLALVKAKQSFVQDRLAGRQPFFVLITALVVLLAGASHGDKVALLFSTRGSSSQGLGERLKLALDRYRQRPVRYFTMVSLALGLLLVAGGCYIYLDVDKRASERAIGMLQFCHLALNNAQSQRVLVEQRKNLDDIQHTAGQIRSLVDKLPPAEKRKAQEIVGQMNRALGQQGQLVSEYLSRTQESSKLVREQTSAMQKGLLAVEAGLSGLKSMPVAVQGLSGQVRELEQRLAQQHAKLVTLEEGMRTLLERSAVRAEHAAARVEHGAERAARRGGTQRAGGGKEAGDATASAPTGPEAPPLADTPAPAPAPASGGKPASKPAAKTPAAKAAPAPAAHEPPPAKPEPAAPPPPAPAAPTPAPAPAPKGAP
jgi:hypothetical protein